MARTFETTGLCANCDHAPTYHYDYGTAGTLDRGCSGTQQLQNGNTMKCGCPGYRPVRCDYYQSTRPPDERTSVCLRLVRVVFDGIAVCEKHHTVEAWYRLTR